MLGGGWSTLSHSSGLLRRAEDYLGILPADVPSTAPLPVMADPERIGAGMYHFDGSASVDPDGGPLTFLWDFGDGDTADGSSTTHPYEKPGTYRVTLTVTDDEFESRSTVRQVIVEPPILEVSLAFPGVETALFGKGDTIPVRIGLSAGDGVGDLTDVVFVEPPLTIGPTGALTITSGPAPAIPIDLTLAPRAPPQFFTFELLANQIGPFTLRTQARATDAAGNPAVPGETKRSGRIGALIVAITVLEDDLEAAIPNVIDLTPFETAEGTAPVPATVTIAVTNPLDDPVDVMLMFSRPRIVPGGTPPPPGYRPFAYSEMDAEGFPVPVDPPEIDLGTLAPGETVEREVSALALDGGDVNLTIVANGIARPVGSAPVTVGGAGHQIVEIRDKLVFVFDAEVRLSTVEQRVGAGGITPWVIGGAEWHVIGKMSNRTHDQFLEVTILPALQCLKQLHTRRVAHDAAIRSARERSHRGDEVDRLTRRQNQCQSHRTVGVVQLRPLGYGHANARVATRRLTWPPTKSS